MGKTYKFHELSEDSKIRAKVQMKAFNNAYEKMIREVRDTDLGEDEFTFQKNGSLPNQY